MSRLTNALGPLLPIVLAFGASLALSPTPRTSFASDAGPPLLGAEAVQAALAGRPQPDGIATDALAFHTRKLAERPDEPLPARALASTRLLRFRAYGNLDELARAEPLIQALVDRYPRDPGVHGLRRTLALSRHDFQRALDAARDAAATSPVGDEGAALGLFDVLMAVGEYDEARELLEGLDPHHLTQGYLSRKARLVDGLGDVNQAAVLMDEVARLTEAYADKPVIRAWALVESGTFRLHSGDPETGVARYRKALELVPGYPAALEALGWIAYGVDGDLAAAEALLARSLANGGHLDIYTTLQEIATARGQVERARAYRAAFLREARTHGEYERLYWRPLARTLADDPGTLDEARRLAERDLAQRRDHAAYATLGWVLQRQGETAAALRAMERAVAWGLPSPRVLELAGRVFYETGDESRGRALLRQALRGEVELGPVRAREIRALLAQS